MSQQRQSELFASQDWKVLYRAFSQINFNATDPGSINAALRDYIRTNYPEDFNDWIESSEFVAIIDLLAWLAGTLAFKIDINARENFLETATARESILRLARFLSYNPSRNRPATGLVKIVEISSDDDVTDSNGRSLANRPIQWNNADDPDWYENFTTVLNAAFVSTNPFGTPLKSGSVSNVATQLYRVNSRNGDNDMRFNARVTGTGMDFELCNGDFDDAEMFRERTPDPNAAFHLFYRNDSNGNSSADTGFFIMFKQGQLSRQLFKLSSPVENQLLNIEAGGVTEDDVWVQTLNDDGTIRSHWQKVPSILSQNITFNSLPVDQRDIYQVITRDEDRISVRFSDGIFGTAPVGNISVWHRIANGQQYVVKPFDINRVTRLIKYVNRRGVERTLRIVFSNFSQVSNATARESEAEVKRRAPAVYSAQSRMVSGEDYNVFPLSSNLAVKLKAVVRTYAGHSRHIDLNDPTSTYQDTLVTSDDGAIYGETANIYEEVPVALDRSPIEMVEQHIHPLLKKVAVRNYVLAQQIERAMRANHALAVPAPAGTWTQATVAKFSSTGWFSTASTHFKEGATLRFKLPDDSFKWVTIAKINGSPTVAPSGPTKGPVTLAEAIPTGSTLTSVIPAYVPLLPFSVSEAVQGKISLGLSFSLWFDPLKTEWLLRDFSKLTHQDAAPSNAPSAIKVMVVESTGDTLWKLSARGHRMVFESARKVKWFHDAARVTDIKTGARKIDSITILSTNPDVRRTDGHALGKPCVFNTDKMYYYANGTHEPRRVEVVFTDEDEDGCYDNPDAFFSLVSDDVKQNTLFWKLGVAFGHQSYIPISNVTVYATEQLLNEATKAANAIAYRLDNDAFYVCDGASWVIQNRRDFKTARGRGLNVAAKWVDDTISYPKPEPLTFHWRHYAQVHHRIDMARSNLIDLFVLSNEYDFLTRNWIANGSDVSDIPTPPSELDLRLMFRPYEEFKMFTDETIWRPVRYKFLFGSGAEGQNLRAKFKVIKLPNSNVADGEIKSRVIRAINQYFDVTRWDFGETFYFTELSAFVHQQLASVIASFVIVPQDEEATFGDIFEVTAQSDEIFISTAHVNDVEIINSNTSANLRIR